MLKTKFNILKQKMGNSKNLLNILKFNNLKLRMKNFLNKHID